MKKTYLAGLVALAFAGNAMAENESGEINFVGSIYAGSCTVTINVDGAGTTNATNLVTLAAVSTSDFLESDNSAKDAGAVAGGQDFSVDFSACSDNDQGIFELALAGDFTGNEGVVNAVYDADATDATLGFQISDNATGTPADVDWLTDSLKATVTDGSEASFSFPLNVAYYQTTAATPTAGIARASVNYLVSYQ